MDAEVGRILSELEEAGRTLRSVRCDVRYQVDDRLNLSQTTRTGTIMFKRAEPHPLFLIQFDKLITDDIVKRDKEWWLFRDRWLSEAKSISRTTLKKEILRPGEQADFFDLEKAPFPMPFGQRKQQILDNFTVALVAPQVGDPPDCDHLVCRPRPKAPLAKEYARLDFYVARRSRLPVRIMAEAARGDNVSAADFAKLESADLNLELRDEDFRLPDETRGYHVSEEPLGSGEEPGGPRGGGRG